MGFIASCISRTRAQQLSLVPIPAGIDETYDVDVTEFVQPEVVSRVRSGHEVSLFKILVEFLSRNIELVENPFLDKAFTASGLLN